MSENILLTKEEMEAFIRENESVLNEDVRMNGKDVTRQTYVYTKNGYMFHIIVVDTPVIFGENDHRKVSLRQLYYDLRNSKIHIGLGNRKLKPSMNSLDNIVSNKTLELIEVDENRGMYAFMVQFLAVLPNSYEIKHSVGRALIRLIGEYSKLELVYKATPVLMKVFKETLENAQSEYNIEQPHVKDMMGRVLRKVQMHKDTKKPKDVFEVSTKSIIKRAEKQLLSYIENGGRGEYGYGSVARLLWYQITSQSYNTANQYVEYIELEDNLIKLGVENTSREPFDIVRIDLYVQERMMAGIRELREEYGNSKKLIEYIFYQCDQTQALTPAQAINLLRDYYRLVRHLPRFRKYPKYLKTAHDIAARNYKVIESDILKNGMKDRYKDYAPKLQMQLGEYIFVVPKEAKELAEEGAQQGNCVAGYANHVAKGNTSIVFMRHKDNPTKSLATVEVRAGQVVQALGAYNNRLSQDILKPLAKWALVTDLEMRVGDKSVVKSASSLIMKRGEFVDYRVAETVEDETVAV